MDGRFSVTHNIRQNKNRFLAILTLTLLLVWVGGRSTLISPPAATAQGKTGLVVAHYYAWFDPSSFDAGKTPFTNPNPYFSTDQGIMRQHVQQAQSVGIDAFVQSWYGPEPSQQTEPNFAALLNIASESGFRAAVNFESVSGFLPDNNARIGALQSLINGHANHPAYLRMDGKPVIFFWANWALSVDEWSAIRNAADPNRTTIWIAEGGNYDYLSVFDGMYLYNIAWSDNPAGINIGQGGNTRAATGRFGSYKYWVGTAMPGFNDALLGRGGQTIVRDRGGGNFYRSSFSGAVQSGPDMIAITSFNEWPEGSHIEASNEFGDFYLGLTRELISTYKGGGVPSSAPVAPAAPPPSAPETEPETGSTDTDPTSSSGSDGVSSDGAILGQALPAPNEEGRIVYQVQPNDTLIIIAVRFDILLEEIYRLNPNLNNQSLLSVGQEIVLGEDVEVVGATATAVSLAAPTDTPTPSVAEGFPGTAIDLNENAIVYTVQDGDTLIGIADRYQQSIDALYELNGLSASSLLSVGQDLIVGYIPTPSSDLRGGSADIPLTPSAEADLSDQSEVETVAVTSTPLPLTVTPTLPPDPSATPAPTEETPAATEVALESVSAGSDSPPTSTDAASAVTTTAADSGLSMIFWILVAATGTLLLITLGLFMVYLSQRTSVEEVR